MAAQMILGLSIIVGLHEFGHMITAKLFGMRVEQFSIGFPPKILKLRKGETEYSIGAIPLGGYVKISGMIDESMDVEKMKEDPKPYEFRSKPAWQRLIVMMGGIIMNVITGLVIFIFMVFRYGESYTSSEEGNKYGIVAYDAAQDIGLKTWDKILKINGEEYEKFSWYSQSKTYNAAVRALCHHAIDQTEAAQEHLNDLRIRLENHLTAKGRKSHDVWICLLLLREATDKISPDSDFDPVAEWQSTGTLAALPEAADGSQTISLCDT